MSEHEIAYLQRMQDDRRHFLARIQGNGGIPDNDLDEQFDMLISELRERIEATDKELMEAGA